MPNRLLTKWTVASGLVCFAVGCAHTISPPTTVAAPATQTTGFYVPPSDARSEVFGDTSNVQSVAFVCDASGSMMEKMEALKVQLTKALTGLQPYQKFSITFFQNETPTFIDRHLIDASPGNKRLAARFIAEVSTNGSTDPIPGLDIAFSQHPQIVYLLTDGDFPDNQKVVDEIHKLDPDRKVKVDTIAFTDSADHDVDFRKILKQIADEYGGTFKSVNEEELK
jgi:von Willebrand factor type A domain